MDDAMVEQIRLNWREDPVNEGKTTVPGKVFLAYRARPLLTINFVAPLAGRGSDSGDSNSKTKKRPHKPTMDPAEIGQGPFIAIGLSFPNLDDTSDGKTTDFVTYRLNKTALQEIGLLEAEEEEEDVDAID